MNLPTVRQCIYVLIALYQARRILSKVNYCRAIPKTVFQYIPGRPHQLDVTLVERVPTSVNPNTTRTVTYTGMLRISAKPPKVDDVYRKFLLNNLAVLNDDGWKSAFAHLDGRILSASFTLRQCLDSTEASNGLTLDGTHFRIKYGLRAYDRIRRAMIYGKFD